MSVDVGLASGPEKETSRQKVTKSARRRARRAILLPQHFSPGLVQIAPRCVAIQSFVVADDRYPGAAGQRARKGIHVRVTASIVGTAEIIRMVAEHNAESAIEKASRASLGYST